MNQIFFFFLVVVTQTINKPKRFVDTLDMEVLQRNQEDLKIFGLKGFTKAFTKRTEDTGYLKQYFGHFKVSALGILWRCLLDICDSSKLDIIFKCYKILTQQLLLTVTIISTTATSGSKSSTTQDFLKLLKNPLIKKTTFPKLPHSSSGSGNLGRSASNQLPKSAASVSGRGSDRLRSLCFSGLATSEGLQVLEGA